MPSITETFAHPSTAPPRPDPSRELYHRACDVRAAAANLRVAAARPNNDAAVAATIRCLENAFEQAATATGLLREGSVRRVRGAWPVLGDEAATSACRLAERFDDAAAAIREAKRACAELRAAAGPVLAELSVL